MELLEVVQKLTGKIDPIGETNEDSKRLENLKVTCQLVEALLSEINFVARSSHSYEGSVKSAGTYAHGFIRSIKEDYE